MKIREKIDAIFPEERDIPEKFRRAAPLEQREYLAGGELRHWRGPMQDVYSPVLVRKDGRLSRFLLGRYPLLTARESQAALEAAVRAYGQGRGQWPSLPVQDRIAHIEQFIHRIKGERDEIARLIMWEIGKSAEDSAREFDRTIEYMVNTVEALKDLDRNSSRFVIEQGIIGQIRRTPLGVALCMGPFNYPLNETFTSVIPALIMGNAVIFKPPKLGVLCHRPFLEAFRDCFPAGVINTVYGHGSEVVSPLMASGRIDILAFVGTSKVADQLKKQHPKPHRLRSSLGLEGKNAAIIMPDADLDLTVSECLLGALSFNGQRCTALKLLYVHADVLEVFLDKFSQALSGLQFGMPWQPEVFITPLPEPRRPGYLRELLEDALSHGARVVNEEGGAVHESFFYPAILCPVGPGMRVYQEEQFGPLIPVVPFTDVEATVEGIINSNYGQQVSIFSTDAATVAHLVDSLATQVGRVNINSQCQRGPDTFPFTGRKDSAEGTLSVHDALRVFSLRTLVAAKETPLNKRVLTEIVRERRSTFLSTDFIL